MLPQILFENPTVFFLLNLFEIIQLLKNKDENFSCFMNFFHILLD